MILVTGGAGFIGSNFILDWLAATGEPLVNLDKLTYAGNLENLASLAADRSYLFVRGDINDTHLVKRLLQEHHPRAIVHFAAESHVDRSIHGPAAFMETNVVGTFRLLEAARHHWASLEAEEKVQFRFLHISTDEVYGSLEPGDVSFRETSPFMPNSPYSASKAAADHWVRAYHQTYGLPVLTTHCSNNYGPYQFPEKFIPLIILNALRGKPLPIYGDGLNIRDWLYVGDHCAALRVVLAKGTPGETYNIGGDNEKTNLDVMKMVCAVLDELRPDSLFKPHQSLLTFVKDRPGHDRRYAIDAGKISQQLDWRPEESFAGGIRKTVQWYFDHSPWLENITSGAYQQWVTTHYRPAVRQ